MAVTVLWFVLVAIGYLLLAVLIILLAVMLIPYEYRLAGDNLVEPLIAGHVSWLYGGLKLNFRYDFQGRVMVRPALFGISLSNKAPGGRPAAKIKPKEKLKSAKHQAGDGKKQRSWLKKKPADFRQFLKIDLLRQAGKVMAKFFQHCRPRIFRVDARIGLGDPMLSGLLCALNGQFYYLLDRYEIRLQPVFDEDTISGSFQIGGRIWLAYLMALVCGFLITKSMRKIIMTQLKMKIRGGLYDAK